MKTIEDIDSALRRRAKERLEADLTKSFEALWAQMCEPFKNQQDFGYGSDPNDRKYIGEAWVDLKKRFRDTLLPHYEQREIHEFIKSVDEAKAQFAALDSNQ